MADRTYLIHEHRDLILTIATSGRVRAYEVDADGGLVEQDPAVATARREAPLSLTRTGEEGDLIVGVLASPDGTFQIKASPSAWADFERDVAAGRNPVVLKPADPDSEQEINR